MIPNFTFKCYLLDLFLKSLGDGFPQVIQRYNQKLNPDYLKYKKNVMYYNWGYKEFSEIYNALHDCVLAFTDGESADEETLFSEKRASDKYFYCFRELFYNFFKFNNTFLYESLENSLAYLVARVFYTEESCENYETVNENEKFEENMWKQLSEKSI